MKQFNTVEEVLVDPFYIEALKNEMRRVAQRRANRPPAGPGRKYTRDIFDRMHTAGTFRDDYFNQHIVEIWKKGSNLPSAERAFIQSFCDDAFEKTMIHYQKMAEQAVPVEKKRKARKTPATPVEKEIKVRKIRTPKSKKVE